MLGQGEFEVCSSSDELPGEYNISSARGRIERTGRECQLRKQRPENLLIFTLVYPKIPPSSHAAGG